MKIFKLTIVLVLCIFTEATKKDTLTSQKEVPIGPNESTTHAPEPSTTPAPPSPPTTARPTTPSSTTTTAKPTTKPSTTAKPTTPSTTTTTSTTTPVPSTTTTTKPTTTTPSPNPSKPDVGTWNVTEPGTDIICILAKMAMQIEVDYEYKNDTRKAVLNVPANATANGTCNNLKSNQLSIKWTDAKHNITNFIIFNFVNNTNTSTIGLNNILVNLNGLMPNEKEPMNFFYNHTVFETPLTSSYKCKKEQTLTLINAKNDTSCKAMLTVSQLQMQAFRSSNTTDFGNAIDCISSTPDIVPIAVGCALAALVVIVLLAYLYGRRRSQARGYLSM